MKTYWDLSDQERAALSHDDVAKFSDAELMLKGVLAPKPLELVEVPTCAMPTRTYYAVNGGPHDTGLDVVFTSEADARAFLQMAPFVKEREWSIGDVNCARAVPRVSSIQTIELPSRDDVEAFRAVLKEQQAAKAENDRRRRAFDEQQTKVDGALRDLWEDWHRCCATAARMAEIRATREKYLGLADGSEEVASKFLAMAFTPDQLAEAAEWGQP